MFDNFDQLEVRKTFRAKYMQGEPLAPVEEVERIGLNHDDEGPDASSDSQDDYPDPIHPKKDDLLSEDNAVGLYFALIHQKKLIPFFEAKLMNEEIAVYYVEKEFKALCRERNYVSPTPDIFTLFNNEDGLPHWEGDDHLDQIYNIGLQLRLGGSELSTIAIDGKYGLVQSEVAIDAFINQVFLTLQFWEPLIERIRKKDPSMIISWTASNSGSFAQLATKEKGSDRMVSEHELTQMDVALGKLFNFSKKTRKYQRYQYQRVETYDRLQEIALPDLKGH